MSGPRLWSESRFRVLAFLLGQKNNDNVLNKYNYKSFFFGDFPAIPENAYEHGIPDFKNNIVDGVPEYSANSLGYRGPEFSKDTEIIFAGDSHSYGIGLPDRFMWTNIVGNKIGKNYVNLSMPGASIQSCVSNIIYYIANYGKPKAIFFATPDLGRMISFNNGKTVISSSFNDTKGIVGLQLEPYADLNSVPSFLKKPYNLEQIMPVELAIFNSLKDIRFLEQYCIDAGIDLYWTCFSAESHYMIKLLKKENHDSYTKFVDTKQDHWVEESNIVNGVKFYNKMLFDETKIEIRCHEEYRDIAKELFVSAGDTDQISTKSRKPHYGAHRHLHLAESMLEAYSNDHSN